jgi:uncharacterized membrane protein YhaH (DUF805 family)
MVGTSSGYFKRFYFSFQGRTGRQAYWIFYFLPVFLIGVVLGFLSEVLRLPSRNLLAVLIVLAPFIVWIHAAVSVKRLHDFNRSGWWAILCFVPYLNYVAVPVLGVIPGKTGSNSYGDDPRRARPQAL